MGRKKGRGAEKRPPKLTLSFFGGVKVVAA